MKKYPYFKKMEESFRNTINNCLSRDDCFRKVRRQKDGKYTWKINPDCTCAKCMKKYRFQQETCPQPRQITPGLGQPFAFPLPHLGHPFMPSTSSLPQASLFPPLSLPPASSMQHLSPCHPNSLPQHDINQQVGETHRRVQH